MQLSVRLFPGQGSYRRGALAAVGEHQAVRQLIADVDQVSAEFEVAPLAPLLTGDDEVSDPQSPAERNRSQLALFATAVALSLVEGEPDETEILAGHSIGEIAALTAAGAFDVGTATRIVCWRNSVLDSEPTASGGMIAIGATASRVRHLLAALDEHRLAVAVQSAPAQTVVSGPANALDELRTAAKAMHIETMPLAAPFAFHNPSLRAAAERFTELLAPLRQHPMRARVYSPIELTTYGDDDDLFAMVASHLYRPIRFVDAIRELHANGVVNYIECSAVGTLGKLVAATVPNVTIGLAGVSTDRSTTTILPGANEVVAPVSPGTVTPEPVPAALPILGEGPDSNEGPDAADGYDRDAVLADLRSLYASALDYPESVIGDGADLEADLGVDSMQQTELLVKVSARYRLPLRDTAADLTEYTTLSDVADFVVAERRSAESTTPSEPVDRPEP